MCRIDAKKVRWLLESKNPPIPCEKTKIKESKNQAFMDWLGIKPKATKPAYVIALTSKAFVLNSRIKQHLARFV